MKKIKDRILVGAISGMIVSVPFQIFNALIHKKGITDVSYSYADSKIFLDKSVIKTPGAKVLSSLINFTGTAIFGTAASYTLSFTGKDKAAIKGAGIGAIMWISVAGLLTNLGLNTRSKRPSTPIISLGEHILSGALCGLLITKIGHNSLFPNEATREQEKNK